MNIFSSKLKVLWFNLFEPKVSFERGVKILGYNPIFKIPKNGRVHFANNVVINSDYKNTNTSLTYRCKFVIGYTGAISIGESTMLIVKRFADSDLSC